MMPMMSFVPRARAATAAAHMTKGCAMRSLVPLVIKAPLDERKKRVMSGMIIEPMTIDPTIAEIPSPKLISCAHIVSSGPSVPRAITSGVTATQAGTGIMSVDTRLIARKPMMVVTVISKLVAIVTSNLGGASPNRSADKPAMASPNRLRLIPNQPNSDREKAILTMRAHVSPKASRTSKQELKPVRAPTEPITQAIKKMISDPPRIEGNDSSEPTPADAPILAINVGSENDTIDAIAATRNAVTRSARGTA